MPPAAVGAVVDSLVTADITPIVTHLASVQLQPQLEVESLLPGFDGFVGSHPIAGRERSGPHHASADLFAQRPWVVCPTADSTPAAVAAVSELARACGAAVTVMSAAAHDTLLARLSHVPQLVASALAGSLVGLERSEVALAGSGLRDTSRLADSDAVLWAEIVAANPAAVAAALRAVVAPLSALADVLDWPTVPGPRMRSTSSVSRAGPAVTCSPASTGSARCTGQRSRWSCRTSPGRWPACSPTPPAAEVNVEDIRVDHSPGQPFGVVELDVQPALG